MKHFKKLMKGFGFIVAYFLLMAILALVAQGGFSLIDRAKTYICSPEKADIVR